MLKFNKKVEYALISMIYLSDKNNGDLTSAREIADRFHIPADLLGKVLQQLSQQDLIGSVRGVKGGYFIHKSLKEISIHQVVSAIDRPIFLVNCAEVDVCECGQADSCNIKNPMMILQEKLVQFFDNLSLEDLKKEQNLRKKKNPQKPAVFSV
jgi:Rrf2 family protein